MSQTPLHEDWTIVDNVIIFILIIIKVGVALSYALWAVSNNFLLFVIARIIGGLSKGNVSLSTAIVTDVTTVEKRSKGMVSNSIHGIVP